MDPQDGSLRGKTSFYYPLLLLPRRQRTAMETLYRFCWAADEIADGPGTPAEKRRNLARFRRNLRLAFRGKAEEPLFQSLQSVVAGFDLTPEPLERILQGVERDLRPLHFGNFQELHRYALQVAGGPGLASMEIFGFKDAPHRSYAENLGVFLQIVNMVRDFREDAALGRRYFPAGDFRRFGLDARRIAPGDPHWRHFVAFQLERAGSFLEKARQALPRRERCGLLTAEAIAAVYERLRQKLKADPRRILQGKTRLSAADKLLAVAGATGRCLLWKGRIAG